ncbi:hypothetical protein ACFVTP_22905 [Streptomyces celluloflavus]
MSVTRAYQVSLQPFHKLRIDGVRNRRPCAHRGARAGVIPHC